MRAKAHMPSRTSIVTKPAPAHPSDRTRQYLYSVSAKRTLSNDIEARLH
jgi:hypothetical protein